MSLSLILALTLLQTAPGPGPAAVPDVEITTPGADSVWCVRNPPRHSSRIRGTVCLTHDEWRAIAQAAHDQNDVVYRRRGALLIDTRLMESEAMARRRIATRRAREAEASGR